jgi:hypothetical protein
MDVKLSPGRFLLRTSAPKPFVLTEDFGVLPPVSPAKFQKNISKYGKTSTTQTVPKKCSKKLVAMFKQSSHHEV